MKIDNYLSCITAPFLVIPCTFRREKYIAHNYLELPKTLSSGKIIVRADWQEQVPDRLYAVLSGTEDAEYKCVDGLFHSRDLYNHSIFVLQKPTRLIKDLVCAVHKELLRRWGEDDYSYAVNAAHWPRMSRNTVSSAIQQPVFAE